MIDKKTEGAIKALKDFLELWGKFHSIYNDIASKEIITKGAEAKFLETKQVIREKYEALKNNELEFKYMPRSRLTDPVSDILNLDRITFISERNLKKLNEDWRDSYIFLNNIMERLKTKKRRLEGFNPIGVFFKRIVEGARR